MGPCLEELRLYTSGNLTVEIPSTLFNCTNLVSLSLQGTIHVTVQHSSTLFRFPSLKELMLYINSMDSVDVLDSSEIIMDLSGCPVLETLEISHPPDSICEICVPPSLKRFEFYFYGDCVCPCLEINAPGLQYLNIGTDGEPIISVIGNLQSVVEAYINVFSPLAESESVNPLLNLLRALWGVKKLKLPCLTTELLFCAPVQDFPEFRYLLHLNITLPSFYSKFLLNMLEKCPMLQDLIILRDEGEPQGKWELQSTEVPNCLVSHLTSFHIVLYGGFQDELLEFAEYILINGLILKTVFITLKYLLDLEEENYIVKRLSDIPRGSAICQIEFIII